MSQLLHFSYPILPHAASRTDRCRLFLDLAFQAQLWIPAAPCFLEAARHGKGTRCVQAAYMLVRFGSESGVEVGRNGMHGCKFHHTTWRRSCCFGLDDRQAYINLMLGSETDKDLPAMRKERSKARSGERIAVQKLLREGCQAVRPLAALHDAFVAHDRVTFEKVFKAIVTSEPHTALKHDMQHLATKESSRLRPATLLDVMVEKIFDRFFAEILREYVLCRIIFVLQDWLICAWVTKSSVPCESEGTWKHLIRSPLPKSRLGLDLGQTRWKP